MIEELKKSLLDARIKILILWKYWWLNLIKIMKNIDGKFDKKICETKID